MEQIISKEETEKLMSLEGEVKGMGMKTHAEFVLREEGKEGLKKLEQAMGKAGYPVKFKELKEMAFFPLGMEALVLELMQRLFNYDDKKFQEIGKFHTKLSLVTKLFMKYFFSLEMMAKQVPKIWDRYFTVGKQRLVDWDKDKKYIIVRVENFKFHPLHCQILIGTLSTTLGMIVKSEVTCQETKCVYRGDQYHEFLVKW